MPHPKNTSSSSSRKRLGRGLDSLFSPEWGGKKPLLSTQTLGVEEINPSPHQPRKIFDKEYLKELSQSIKKNGLIQPIVVKPKGSTYEIVAGERRWRAAMQAGLHQVPVRILESENPFLALVENLQREDLNPLELAQAYKKLMEEKNLTQEELAQHLGIPRASLANHLRILNLSPLVQNLILKEKLSFAVGKILLQEKDLSSQAKWGEHFARHNTSVQKAQRLLKKTSSSSSTLSPLPEQKEALNKIQSVHGIKSRIVFKKSKNKISGELCLRFFSEQELNFLLEHLLSNKK